MDYRPNLPSLPGRRLEKKLAEKARAADINKSRKAESLGLSVVPVPVSVMIRSVAVPKLDAFTEFRSIVGWLRMGALRPVVTSMSHPPMAPDNVEL